MYKTFNKQIYKEDREKFTGVFWCVHTCLYMKKNGNTYSYYDDWGNTWKESSYTFSYIDQSGWLEARKCLDEKLVEDFILSKNDLNAKDLFWLGLQIGKTFDGIKGSRITSFNSSLLVDFLKNQQ